MQIPIEVRYRKELPRNINGRTYVDIFQCQNCHFASKESPALAHQRTNSLLWSAEEYSYRVCGVCHHRYIWHSSVLYQIEEKEGVTSAPTFLPRCHFIKYLRLHLSRWYWKDPLPLAPNMKWRIEDHLLGQWYEKKEPTTYVDCCRLPYEEWIECSTPG